MRVWMSYRLPPDTVPALAQLLYGVTTVVLIVISNVWYFACGIHRRSSALYLGSPGGPPLPAGRPEGGVLSRTPAAAATCGRCRRPRGPDGGRGPPG